jgi:hypothetical protein
MKKLLLLPILLITTTLFAQTEKQDTLILPHSKAVQLQAILQFSYQWLQHSKAPADDVTNTVTGIVDIYNILWPPKKEEKKVEPKKNEKTH